MSKREYLTRYFLIIKRLRKSPATFNEISDYLEREASFQEFDLTVSKRTLQRDIDEILSIFGIQIEFDFSHKVYHIMDDCQNDWNNRMLEAFEMFDALRLTDRVLSNVYFDKRRAGGSEHFAEILRAVKGNWTIKFDYQKFWEEKKTIRTGEPYALKEFNNRWYVLMKDMKDKTVKSFALDRITDLEIASINFNKPTEYNIAEHFRNCFGIIIPQDDEPQEIILSFDPVQGKYLKSKPLHESQEILLDTKEELRLRITVYVTHDFEMELLSFGDNVKVLAPDSLAAKIQQTLKRSLANYK